MCVWPGDMPGFIIPVEGKLDRFVVGLKRRVVEVQWDGEGGDATVIRELAELDKHSPDNRINDAKADPRGRLFVGEDDTHTCTQTHARTEMRT